LTTPETAVSIWQMKIFTSQKAQKLDRLTIEELVKHNDCAVKETHLDIKQEIKKMGFFDKVKMLFS
jgi:hypothetical protein